MPAGAGHQQIGRGLRDVHESLIAKLDFENQVPSMFDTDGFPAQVTRGARHRFERKQDET